MKAAAIPVIVALALTCGCPQAQQKHKVQPPKSKGKLPSADVNGKLSPPEFAEARLAYCKGHEALAALGFLRHRPGRDADALPLVIQQDFHTMRGADLRMRMWSLNYGMNVAATEQDAKRAAFKHCIEGFGAVMEQMRAGPLR
jgi:hypothetical protein